MDPRLRGFSSSLNGTQLGNRPLSVLSNQSRVSGQRFDNTFIDHNFMEFPYLPPDPKSSKVTPNSNAVHEEDSPEDCDFSDAVLRYVSQMLMEEDMEDKTCMLQDSLDLQAAEKSFYEVLGKKYPPSPEPNHASTCQNSENPYYSFTSNCSDDNHGGSYLDDNTCIQNLRYYDSFQQQTLRVSSMSQSSYSSSNSVITSMDGLVDSPSSSFQISDWKNESQSISQFMKGVEEASKFLPNGDVFFRNIEVNRFLSRESKARISEVTIKEERKDEEEYSLSGPRGRKNLHRQDGDIEERSSKQPAVYAESDMEPHVFDRLLLYSAGEGWEDLKDLSDDCRRANELLKQVRQHSSPFGDGNQRLAHCFANGLESRLAGTGSQIYKGLVSKRTSATNILKAYHLYLAACPFLKLSNFASNKTIMNLSANSMRLHIIDFGILYGFQWPTLIQRLSWRPGGPPNVRITGIDFPQPGFRPAERVEETGRRLATYAKKFNVPFEYSAIAKKWETIKLEELKIDREEVIVVTCFYRARNLLDETVAVDSQKDIVLQLERMLIEKEIIGREALNVVACEGWERVERPETYKQWQVRTLRAGFVQLSFDREIVKRATDKVRTLYHKDFLIDEDGRWLLQGWKGRIIYTLSVWRPT
ncbi:hypothetical protein GH714_010160 [Hevea brasiliensis]|uniref:Uncharacterized protein n=1 Tax=Hevea brasiliensis TaxID=3981 RepID=A0A6A6KK38_HEVBR|nr:hypothetical protein GH714_010160 [Hevea brasiliensis]